jgi:hypothetical protein
MRNRGVSYSYGNTLVFIIIIPTLPNTSINTQSTCRKDIKFLYSSLFIKIPFDFDIINCSTFNTRANTCKTTKNMKLTPD